MDNVQPWHQSKPDRKVCLIITLVSLLSGVLLSPFLPAVICLVGSFWFSRQHYWKWVMTSMASSALAFLTSAISVAILLDAGDVLLHIAIGQHYDIKDYIATGMTIYMPADFFWKLVWYFSSTIPIFLASICLRKKLKGETCFAPVQEATPSHRWYQNPRIRTTATFFFLLLAVFFSFPYYTLWFPPLPILLATFLIYRKFAGEECFAHDRREKAGWCKSQKWYEAKVSVSIFFITLTAVFFTSPFHRAYDYYHHHLQVFDTDLGLVYIITANLIVTLESLFIRQQHYWKWAPLSIPCMIVVSFISEKVYFAQPSGLLNTAMTTQIFDGLIHGGIFLLYSIPWLFLLFFIRKQSIKLWQGGR